MRQIIRCVNSGVFFAEVARLTGTEAVLRNARRLWWWEGAASLSELATSGTSLPSKCKFPASVDRITVLDVCEILDVTETAAASIDTVPVWSAAS